MFAMNTRLVVVIDRVDGPFSKTILSRGSKAATEIAVLLQPNSGFYSESYPNLLL